MYMYSDTIYNCSMNVFYITRNNHLKNGLSFNNATLLAMSTAMNVMHNLFESLFENIISA